MRAFLSMALCFLLALPVVAQDSVEEIPRLDRSVTGGAQTLADILARQRGEKVDDSFRRNATGNPDNAAGMAGQLGTLGGASDAEVWRALRYGLEDIKVSAGGPEARVLIQDGGMRWLEFRKGPLATYGAYLLGGTLVLLALFYLVRGRIRIDGDKTGRTVTRFQAVERFGHWLMAGSFVVLAITGLLVLFGRMVVIPLLGHEAFSTLATGSKWVHNNISWAFMLGLVMVFFMWVLQNIPNRADLKWLALGGGMFSKGVHPPAWKFNAGQKLIFWSTIVFGASIAASGLSMLFPFELPMFAKTFQILNDTGLPQAVGYGPLPEMLAPHEEMQLAQLWHASIGFVLMAIIIAHIYIGSLGMEGAFGAMNAGEVDEQWAREHHGLWLKELQERGHAPASDKAAHPAE